MTETQTPDVPDFKYIVVTRLGGLEPIVAQLKGRAKYQHDCLVFTDTQLSDVHVPVTTIAMVSVMDAGVFNEAVQRQTEGQAAPAVDVEEDTGDVSAPDD